MDVSLLKIHNGEEEFKASRSVSPKNIVAAHAFLHNPKNAARVAEGKKSIITARNRKASALKQTPPLTK